MAANWETFLMRRGTTDRLFHFDEVGLTPDDFNAFEKILGAVTAEQAIAAGAP